MADQNWDHFLQQSSAMGIFKPDAFGPLETGDSTTGGDERAGDVPIGSVVPPTTITTASHTPPVLRVVRTAHTPQGRAVFASDDYVYGQYPFADGAAFAMIDRRSSIPVSHRVSSSTSTSSSSSSSSTLPRCPSTGAAFVLCEIPPFRAAMPLRRTLTVDYVVVVAGEAVLCLNDGEGNNEKTVHAGDVVVQQGTQHTWLNQTAVPCRLLYVMLAGKKIGLANGTVLERSG
ncbi:hypothetical protein SBRCBS47491_002117 [Sporothrix bragantina]|uniref:Cupin 2 conserved barrel domain-containing protein n=1 Tax=Sporothrix bragantina TaxID=671064 RepID=A0ABP0B4B4_9PEZI